MPGTTGPTRTTAVCSKPPGDCRVASKDWPAPKYASALSTSRFSGVSGGSSEPRNGVCAPSSGPAPSFVGPPSGAHPLTTDASTSVRAHADAFCRHDLSESRSGISTTYLPAVRATTPISGAHVGRGPHGLNGIGLRGGSALGPREGRDRLIELGLPVEGGVRPGCDCFDGARLVLDRAGGPRLWRPARRCPSAGRSGRRRPRPRSRRRGRRSSPPRTQTQFCGSRAQFAPPGGRRLRPLRPGRHRGQKRRSSFGLRLGFMDSPAKRQKTSLLVTIFDDVWTDGGYSRSVAARRLRAAHLAPANSFRLDSQLSTSPGFASEVGLAPASGWSAPLSPSPIRNRHSPDHGVSGCGCDDVTLARRRLHDVSSRQIDLKGLHCGDDQVQGMRL